MPTYLKITNIKGNVSTKGFEGAIECETFSHNMKRKVSIRAGSTKNREMTSLTASELTITKAIDKSSPSLLQQLYSARAIPQVELHVCHTSNQPSAYLKYILEDVIVSSREVIHNAAFEPHEKLTLNYSKIQESFIPRDNRNQPLTPVTTGYNITTAETM